MYSFSRYKEQYRANLKLALPVVLSQVGQILVQFADNAMVGRFGGDDPLPLAAVSFGGSVFFILFVTGMGLTLGLTPLVGERFAQGDRRGATDYLKNSVIFYTALGFLIAAVQLAVIPLMYRMGQPWKWSIGRFPTIGSWRTACRLRCSSSPSSSFWRGWATPSSRWRSCSAAIC